MTKRNLWLVGLLVVLGLAVNATSLFATVGSSWTATAGTAYDIRSEGDAEGVAAVTLVSNAVGTIAATSVIAVGYNAPIASNTTGYAFNVTVSGDDAEAISANCLSTHPVVSTYTNDFTEAGEGNAPMPGTTNNRMTITCTANTPVDTSDEFVFTARVAIQGYPNTFEVEENIRVTGTAALPMTISPAYPQLFVVADIEGGAGSGFTTATTVTLHKGPEYELTCIGVQKIPGTSLDHNFALNIAENWPDALTSLSDEYARENDDWAVAPTNGSNILIILTGIPSQVTVQYLGPYVCTTTSYLPCTQDGSLSFGAVDYGTITTGNTYTEWFWYPITATIPSVQANATFPFFLYSSGPLLPGQSYVINAQVELTDIPNTGLPPLTGPWTNGDMPWFSQYEDLPMPVVYFLDCRTNLLFPYINTYQGGSAAFSSFGTGINVANTTLDPFALPATTGGTCDPKTGVGCLYPDEAKGSAVPQSGNCVFYFYPANEATPTVYPTPNISVGGSFAFDVAASAKFISSTGYAIAICNFQNAHGFAEIYDNYVNLAVSGPSATLGYLADVLPDPAFYHRSPAGDGLGETAIAPINIDQHLLKLLMKGKLFFDDGGETTTTTGSSSSSN